MVFIPAHMEVNQYAIDSTDVHKGLDFSNFGGWIREKRGDPRYSGRASPNSQPASGYSGSKLELVLDEMAADGGQMKNQDEWIEYWKDIHDGRVMASAGDLYANFKVLKKLQEQGDTEQKIIAEKYISNLRKDFNGGGLICNTWLVHDIYSSDTRILHRHGCNMPELIKETIVCVYNYDGVIFDVAQDSFGTLFLQALFDTKDKPGQIIQTLEFISEKTGKDIAVLTANFIERATSPSRTVWLGIPLGRFYLGCNFNPASGIGTARGVRLTR
ncbi:MAG: hypothetical protein AABW48_01380 [Nanoarchaeota archaeon]